MFLLSKILDFFRTESASLDLLASLVTVSVRADSSASTSLYIFSFSSRDSVAFVSLSLVSSNPISRFWTFFPKSLISQSAWSDWRLYSLVESSNFWMVAYRPSVSALRLCIFFLMASMVLADLSGVARTDEVCFVPCLGQHPHVLC